MNKTDRERLVTVYQLVSSVPLPHGGKGTQSSTIAGHVGYSEDMRKFLPKLAHIFS